MEDLELEYPTDEYRRSADKGFQFGFVTGLVACAIAILCIWLLS